MTQGESPFDRARARLRDESIPPASGAPTLVPLPQTSSDAGEPAALPRTESTQPQEAGELQPTAAAPTGASPSTLPTELPAPAAEPRPLLPVPNKGGVPATPAVNGGNPPPAAMPVGLGGHLRNHNGGATQVLPAPQPQGQANPAGQPPVGGMVIGSNGMPQRMQPTVRGGILGLGPNETGIERALELANQVSLLEGENRLLVTKVKQLEMDLETRERLIDATNNQVDLAAKDVARARAEIDALRKDLAAARERLKQAAREDLETLQTIVSVLRRLTATTAPMRPSTVE